MFFIHLALMINALIFKKREVILLLLLPIWISMFVLYCNNKFIHQLVFKLRKKQLEELVNAEIKALDLKSEGDAECGSMRVKKRGFLVRSFYEQDDGRQDLNVELIFSSGLSIHHAGYLWTEKLHVNGLLKKRWSKAMLLDSHWYWIAD